MKHNVYLCQVNNTFGNNAFLPYSAGLLQAYAQSVAKIRDNFDFKGFVFLRGEPSQVSLRLENPAVVGISHYIWNAQWNLTFAKTIKGKYPDCLIVLGGPQVPDESENFFIEHPYVDILVHKEGEQAFSGVLLEYMKSEPNYTHVNGLSVKLEGNKCYKTPSNARILDLDELPSPYLTGIFDEIINEPYSFHALQETHRGCPYQCTFCDWGSSVFTKVRRFDRDRITQEFQWFGEHQIEMLYNCDANFALFPEDAYLAEQLVETKKRFGYPEQFRAAWAKNSNSRVFNIAKALNDAGMQKGVTLSLQSVDQSVLEAIQRKNMDMNNFAGLIDQYREEGIPTYTELIMGLPGETYDSFADGVDRLLRAGQHDSLNIYTLSQLPNSEMSDPAYVDSHGIKTVRMPVPLHHSTPSDDDITEYNDTVVETSSMSTQDWKRMYFFAWAVQAFHCLGLTQHIAVSIHGDNGVSYRRFYEALIDRGLHGYDVSVLGSLYARTDRLLDRVLEGKSWDIVLPEFGDITWPPEEAAFLLALSEKAEFYREVEDLVSGLTARPANELIEQQSSMIIDPYLDYGGDLKEYAKRVVWYGRKGILTRLIRQPVESSQAFQD